MATDKLFWKDAYRIRLETRVVAVEDDWVRLAETIIFAFSGGQESDHGSIAGRPVREARKEGLDIRYRLDPGHGLLAGDAVEVLIDWPRRYRLMRLHFAAEMVLQLIYRKIPGIQRIGAHIGEDKARIDFALDTSIASLFEDLQAEVGELVRADLPIRCAFTDEATQRRFWQVEGFAEMACGGTHPRRTGEIGALRLKRRNTGKGKERVEIHLA
ncbi:alanyl-tRNA editing protein [Pseudomonas kuykendallii]|uniref:Alanyl-tRNA editing protein n=1 Tax=Pseudomonas kuykendallii TaxID=1007099 RepID=A0A2W5D478_9PSED|nr:alanyl-tRNA editing protein [Pseudomonas kuykendallii]PZP24147.1 MAG: alanyl-tRNA editing protein [Pseudomonas kuykendallii]